ncbi:MAG: rod shape-determining protein RodA [Thermoanaerobacteraceae bacterium]|nr:rod shape-determining protein RodA [Thermoanaerobacteraceae bacterium]
MRLKYLQKLDFPLLGSLAVILIMSLLVLRSASASITSNPSYFVNKQAVWIIIGTCAMIATMTVNYTQFARYSKALYVLNLILLVLVLIPGVGTEVNGATSWIKLGFFSIQPAEFSKILIIITFANFLVARQGQLNTLKDLVPCFIHFAIPLALILKQPDLGSGLVFLAIMFGMLLVGGARLGLLLGIVVTGLGGAIGAVFLHLKFGLPLPIKQYQLMRLIVFLDPYADGYGGRGAGYNIIQSLAAVGSGKLWGQGLGKGSQVQLNFLPEHHTDFIFSVVGEELGFVGAVFLLSMYFILLYRCLKIAFKAKDTFGALIVAGVVSMFTYHIIQNVGMAIGIMPITGIPLPMFSYGGSSMLANLIAIGLVLNVNLHRKKIMF